MFRWEASESRVPASIHETLRTVDPLKAGRTNSPERECVAPIDQATVDATIAHCFKIVAYIEDGIICRDDLKRDVAGIQIPIPSLNG